MYGLYFDKKGRVVDYKALLTGTSRCVFHFSNTLYLWTVCVGMSFSILTSLCTIKLNIGIVEEDYHLGIPGLAVRKLKIGASVGR